MPKFRETLIKWLRERVAALRGTGNLAVYRILSRLLRSVRLALHLARSFNQRFLSVVLLILLSVLSNHAAAQTYKLRYVYDGDTVKLQDTDGAFKLRIKDIDAPERNQAYGKKARRALMQLCKGKETLVTAQLTGMDKYQRYLGRMQCNNIDVSLYLAEQGLAWFDTKYSSDVAILQAQKIAQQNKTGLWQEPNPTPPWVWRHLQHRAP